MKILKLKPEFEGLIITRNVFGFGNVTFDPSKATPNQYHNFKKYGFDNIFDEVEVCDNCLLQECQCITNNIEFVEENELSTDVEPEVKNEKKIEYDGIKQPKKRGRKKKS